MTYIPDKLRDLVYQRAAACCEYCLIRYDDTYKPQEVDHIVAEKHGGQTREENLCLSCFDNCAHNGKLPTALVHPDQLRSGIRRLSKMLVDSAAKSCYLSTHDDQ